MSLYYMLPFLLLLFSNPSLKSDGFYLQIFIRCLSFVAALNNIVGFVQVMMNPHSDDSFVGIYSEYSISINGLSLINTVLSFYYFMLFSYNKRIITLFLSLFFFVSGVLSFYGAGLAVCLVALILSYLTFDLKRILKPAVIGIFIFAALYGLLLLIKPQVIDYNIANIKKIASFDVKNGPRKITSFYNYAISYPHNAKDFVFGSGPGTFNSRSAFMIGSPSYFSSPSFIKDENKPYYFKNYAYSLWNESNTSQAQYLDGFRNQPFSSLLAFLGEYGLAFTALFFFLYLIYYSKVAGLYRKNPGNEEIRIYFRYFKFTVILLPLLLLIDNYYEYPEIMLLILTLMKAAHSGIQHISSQAQK